MQYQLYDAIFIKDISEEQVERWSPLTHNSILMAILQTNFGSAQFLLPLVLEQNLRECVTVVFTGQTFKDSIILRGQYRVLFNALTMLVW